MICGLRPRMHLAANRQAGMEPEDQTAQETTVDRDRVAADPVDLVREEGVDRGPEAGVDLAVLDQVALGPEVAVPEDRDQEDLVRVDLVQEVADQVAPGQEDLDQEVADQEARDQVAPGPGDLGLVVQVQEALVRADLDQVVLDREDQVREVADQVARDREVVDQVVPDREVAGPEDRDQVVPGPGDLGLVAARAREAGVDLAVVPGQAEATGDAAMESLNKESNAMMGTPSITTTAPRSACSPSAETASPTKTRRNATI